MWMRLTETVREFIPKTACRMLKKMFVILRDEEVGGLDMVTTDEDRVLPGKLNRDQFKKIRRLRCSKNFIIETVRE